MRDRFVFDSFDYSVFDVAKFFLAIGKHDPQEKITSLKLQKLVYYAQAASLAFYKKTLFNEEIQAWLHGPVCPKLYEHFKEDVFDLCTTEQKRVMTLFSQNINAYQILSDVWSHFGKYDGVKLENTNT